MGGSRCRSPHSTGPGGGGSVHQGQGRGTPLTGPERSPLAVPGARPQMAQVRAPRVRGRPSPDTQAQPHPCLTGKTPIGKKPAVRLESGWVLPASSASGKKGLCGAGVQGCRAPGPWQGRVRLPRTGAESGPDSGASVPALLLPHGARPARLPAGGSGGRGEKVRPGGFPALGLSSPPVHMGGRGSLGVGRAGAPLSLEGKPRPWPSHRPEAVGILELGALWAQPAWAPRSLGRGPWDTGRHRILASIPPGHCSLATWLQGVPAAADS